MGHVGQGGRRQRNVRMRFHSSKERERDQWSLGRPPRPLLERIAAEEGGGLTSAAVKLFKIMQKSTTPLEWETEWAKEPERERARGPISTIWGWGLKHSRQETGHPL